MVRKLCEEDAALTNPIVEVLSLLCARVLGELVGLWGVVGRGSPYHFF